MDFKVNTVIPSVDVHAVPRSKTPATSVSASVQTSPSLGGQDQAPVIGKQAQALETVNLFESPQPLAHILAEAFQALNQDTAIPWGLLDVPLKPSQSFAEREADMTRNLNAKLNQKVFNDEKKSWHYACSHQEIEAQIKQLKQEVKAIAHQRQHGMIDCNGGLTNRQIACEAVIRALENCLKQRSLTQASRVAEPQVQICGPFPWEEKVNALKP